MVGLVLCLRNSLATAQCLQCVEPLSHAIIKKKIVLTFIYVAVGFFFFFQKPSNSDSLLVPFCVCLSPFLPYLLEQLLSRCWI